VGFLFLLSVGYADMTDLIGGGGKEGQYFVLFVMHSHCVQLEF